MASITGPALQRPVSRPVPMLRAIGFPVLLAAFLGYVMLLPPQFNLNIGTTTVPPFRLILIPALAFIVLSYARGHVRFRLADAFALLLGFWVTLAMFMTTEAIEAFTAAVAQTSDMVIAYFFGRATIRSPRDFRVFLLLVAPALFAAGALVAIESITHRPIVQPIAAALLGGDYVLARPDFRLGLLRARGSFPHPILAGVFLASFLPLYLLSGLRGWPRLIGSLGAVFAFFTVSSAALLGLTTGLILTGYNWLSERISNLSWRMFFAVSAIFVFVAEASGAGTYRLLIRYGSLNSSSAYNRIRIWNYGTRNVEANPWFGIGYADWDRPDWLGDSVDNFWLLTAMRFGLIPPTLTLLMTLLAALAMIRIAGTAGTVDRRTLTGVVIALSVFAFGATSVALWGSALVWFFMMIGLGVSLGAQPQQRLLRAPQHQSARRTAKPPKLVSPGRQV